MEAIDPQATLDKNLAQYAKLSNGVIRCTETRHFPADPYPEESARVDITSFSLVYRIPYSDEAIRQWVEARRKPYSQICETTLSFCGDVYRYDTRSDPGLFYPHGCNFTQIWDANRYILINHLSKTVHVYDLQSFTNMLYDVYPHPKLFLNVPAFFLASAEVGGVTHEIICSPTDPSQYAVRIFRQGRFLAQADMVSEGFIGFRNAQYSSDGHTVSNIRTEGAFQDISAVPLFPKRIWHFRSILAEKERENLNISPEWLWQLIEAPSYGEEYTDLIVETTVFNLADMTERDLYPTIPKGWHYQDNRAATREKRISEGKDAFVGGEIREDISLAVETPIASLKEIFNSLPNRERGRSDCNAEGGIPGSNPQG